METDSLNSKVLLRSQIENCFGKVCYSFTSNEKKIQTLKIIERRIKISQIVLSAVTAGSLLTVLLGQNLIANVSATLVSIVLLCLNSISLKFDFAGELNSHTKAADKLWIIRENYISLLTDFVDLSVAQIRERRDILQDATAGVYSSSPRTDSKSYKESQKALKQEEEQYFSFEEINQLLPPELRHKGVN